jgi:hypothetical protein
MSSAAGAATPDCPSLMPSPNHHLDNSLTSSVRSSDLLGASIDCESLLCFYILLNTLRAGKRIASLIGLY